MSTCCLRSTLWEGTPTGTVTTLPGAPNPVYVAKPPANSTSRAAVLLVHDILGWTFPNARLVADAYAREADATVYLPDFFGGEVVPFEPILAGRFDQIDLPAWMVRNSREVREPEIVAFARALRASGEYDRIGAIGFCFGGWAVFRLGAQEFVQDGKGLVDCISAGHPTWVTEKDIEEVGVPVQLLAPELDIMFTAEMKLFAFSALQRKGVPFDYQHLPGVMHGCLTRGDASQKGERDAMVRGKNAAVAWFRQWLHE